MCAVVSPGRSEAHLGWNAWQEPILETDPDVGGGPLPRLPSTCSEPGVGRLRGPILVQHAGTSPLQEGGTAHLQEVPSSARPSEGVDAPMCSAAAMMARARSH